MSFYKEETLQTFQITGIVTNDNLTGNNIERDMSKCHLYYLSALVQTGSAKTEGETRDISQNFS